MVSYVSQYTILIVRVCGHSLSCYNRSNLTTTYLLSPVYEMSDVSPLEGCMSDYWCNGHDSYICMRMVGSNPTIVITCNITYVGMRYKLES